MRNLFKTSAIVAALAGVGVAFGQDTTTTTNIFSSLGVLGPVLLIAAIVLWWSWGGFRWILPN